MIAPSSIAAAVLTNQEFLPELKPDDEYRSINITAGAFKKLGFIRKTNLTAYGYLIEALKMIEASRLLSE